MSRTILQVVSDAKIKRFVLGILISVIILSLAIVHLRVYNFMTMSEKYIGIKKITKV